MSATSTTFPSTKSDPAQIKVSIIFNMGHPAVISIIKAAAQVFTA
jgi:hypothetical protein